MQNLLSWHCGGVVDILRAVVTVVSAWLSEHGHAKSEAVMRATSAILRAGIMFKLSSDADADGTKLSTAPGIAICL